MSLPGLPPVTPRSVRPEDSPAHLLDVSVTCSASDLVVRVKRAFFGLGADAEELTLGSGCRSTGVLRPHGDLLFTYNLTECGAVRQVSSAFLSTLSRLLSSCGDHSV